ncbi:GDP-fucose protein O-fucosyltransferase family protein [Skeletonema marinoi]|uniref:GDP-fucose protein O-fucosyltransferase family protein n=1 Tax=Skeletonema marinoi TaxID=267567 RepID=A0AAD8YIR2_9STRA|nr:GDP-fucose protein O-fucosyltransferase family protein [Skeletonema marinoi]
MRISFEIVVLLAALSGRTLVLPPEQVMYLLQPKPGDKRQGRRQYTDYYNLTDNIDLLRHVPIISAEEFLHLEGGEDGLVPLTGYNDTWTKHLYTVSTSCEERKKSDVFCEDLYDHYASHGLVGPITSEVKYANCLVFDENVFLNGNNQIDKLAPDVQKRIKAFCGDKRYPVYYNMTMHDTPVWHFETRDLDHRLLVHFYSILFFTDGKVEISTSDLQGTSFDITMKSFVQQERLYLHCNMKIASSLEQTIPWLILIQSWLAAIHRYM